MMRTIACGTQWLMRAGLCLLLALLALGARAQSEQRVALVIGNTNYRTAPLKNPGNDARDIANSLRGFGFSVIERTNLTTRQIGPTLREFRARLAPGGVAVVFYAGHGLQIRGENYLPAIDAEIHGEEDVPTQSLSTRQIMDVLAEAKTRMNIVFLDACRENPYARSFRSASRGLSRENAPSGTLISFATRPGSVAADGEGRNGLYTGVLLQQLRQADQPIEQVLKRVVSGVKQASRGQQEPWSEGSIEGDFCFGRCAPVVAVAAAAAPAVAMPPPQRLDEEKLFWDQVKDSADPQDLSSYLRKFPEGLFVELANNRLSNLRSRESAPARSPADSGAQLAALGAIPDAMVRNFMSFMPGRWGADCTRLVSVVRLEGNRLLGDTFFNGVLGSQLTLRVGSVKYMGLQNGLHQFEYHVDTKVMANNATTANRIIMETDLQSVRRTVYSEHLTTGAVYIRDGIVLSNNTSLPMQKRCN